MMTFVDLLVFFFYAFVLSTLCRWKPEPVPDDVAFESIKTSLDSVAPGTKMFINSGLCFI